MARRAPRWVAALAGGGLAAVTLTGCRAQLTVGVDAGSGGAGTVAVTLHLDRDGAAQFPHLARQLQVSDLTAAGWELSEPTDPAGGENVELSHAFSGPAQADALLAQLTGPGGAVRDVRLTQDRSLGGTRTRLSGTVDLSGGLDALADPALLAQLGGHLLGVDPAAPGLGPPAARQVAVRVRAVLPGSVRAAGAAVHGSTATWAVPLGGRVQLAATAWRRDPVPLVVVAAAVVAALGGVAGVVRRRRGVRGDVTPPS